MSAIRAAVMTVSDKGSRSERVDQSGPAVAELLLGAGMTVACTAVVPDERDRIEALLVEWSDVEKFDLIVTTGGTGVSPRDVTPDATLAVIDREIPGMGEAMRRESAAKTPHAVISRATAGIRGSSLILNLPGSPKGARENLLVVLPALKHAVEKIKGDDRDCAA
ncbi:MAG: Molybdopterin adenylyltransferase [Syntrophaceae bacterium PtaU1.Bin231]|nr:MAG: Molybdopterin adenylyltransferase [Syntrophaceae bacterium PtaU1.Bin231]HOG17728.1 MogA/MoaB family molybdenum cofactor biosynthesis protein [Syntrophales bacterium]